MVNLGDYIGQVLAELTIARVQADLEAVRVAELYSRHELLKHFPIPKIRLSEFDVELRFLILDTETKPKKNIVVKQIGKNFKKFTMEVVGRRNITLTANALLKLDSMTSAKVTEAEASTARKFDLPSMATRMTPIIENVLEDNELDIETIREIQNEVDHLTRDSILTELSDNRPRLNVAVTSKELKEASPDTITSISLKATEEGLEWSQITPESEDGKNSVWRLVPE